MGKVVLFDNIKVRDIMGYYLLIVCKVCIFIVFMRNVILRGICVVFWVLSVVVVSCFL